jgi:hypothetical protein
VFKGQRGLEVLSIALLLALIALSGGCTSSSEPALDKSPDDKMLVAVETLDEGRIRVERGGRMLVVDLVQEISGCTGRIYDPTVNKEYGSGVVLEIVDETERVPYTYLVLLASAPANCNVQGMCAAAGPDSTLIWLKFAEDLSLAERQAYVIVNCGATYSSVLKALRFDEFHLRIQARDLPWIDDRLQIEFEEGAQDSIQRLIYDRRNPDAGLQQIP